MFQILTCKRPSNLVKSNAKEQIKNLYDNDEIPYDSKKSIINVLLGLLEKKMNKNTDCQLFVNKHEAQCYIDESGGEIGELSYYEELVDEHSIFADGSATQSEQRIIYTVIKERDTELVTGFFTYKRNGIRHPKVETI